MDPGCWKWKQAIVLRTDLGMSTGKLAVQACHASLGASEKVRQSRPHVWRSWQEEGGRKIALAVGSLERLLELDKRARSLGIETFLVRDRGLTEIPPGTVTALGIGPDEGTRVDKVTGNLPLLK